MEGSESCWKMQLNFKLICTFLQIHREHNGRRKGDVANRTRRQYKQPAAAAASLARLPLVCWQRARQRRPTVGQDSTQDALRRHHRRIDHHGTVFINQPYFKTELKRWRISRRRKPTSNDGPLPPASRRRKCIDNENALRADIQVAKSQKGIGWAGTLFHRVLVTAIEQKWRGGGLCWKHLVTFCSFPFVLLTNVNKEKRCA